MRKSRKKRRGNRKRAQTKCASTADGESKPKPSLRIEPLEPRILLSATWTGTDGDDVFDGTNDVDVAEGLDGADELHGGKQDDPFRFTADYAHPRSRRLDRQIGGHNVTGRPKDEKAIAHYGSL